MCDNGFPFSFFVRNETHTPYSKEFRKHVFEYKKQHGLTFEQTSEHFGVHISSLFRWVHLPEPCKSKNRPSIKIDMEKLAKDVEQRSDDYQWERAERFNVGQSTIHYALKRLNTTFKKSLRHPKANEAHRQSFQIRIKEYEKNGYDIL